MTSQVPATDILQSFLGILWSERPTAEWIVESLQDIPVLKERLECSSKRQELQMILEYVANHDYHVRKAEDELRKLQQADG